MTFGWGQRSLALAALVAAITGCGATRTDEPSTTSSSASATPTTMASQPAPGPEPGPSIEEQPLAHVEPTDPGLPAITPGTECSGAGECTRSYFSAPPVTEADCACPTCDRFVVGIAHLNELSEADARVCGAWRRSHPCPSLACPDDGLRSTCVRGACVALPIVEAGEPSPCRSPTDCPRGAACVVSALGGDLGCTNETCCSAAECTNGCASDADCPSCRPSCVSGACRNPSGPK